ncbi:MAG: protein TolQ [Deltaproteobacteria bacterium]|nr:protein TolQ [Deltaproteobacteria bacterium]
MISHLLGVLGPTVISFGNVAASETVMNLFAQSGTMVQAVLMLLLIFSVSSWGIIFYKVYQLRQAHSASQSFATLFRSTKDFAMLAGANLNAPSSPLARIFATAYQEFSQWRQTSPQTTPPPETRSSANLENLELTLRRAVREQMTWLERTLTFLATTASTTPFIGLFGTVWGIMNAFQGLSTAQSATIQAVAPGIAEALVTTAVGLLAAIPAVMAYNHFIRQVQVLTAEMDGFSAELLSRVRWSLQDGPQSSPGGYSHAVR